MRRDVLALALIAASFALSACVAREPAPLAPAAVDADLDLGKHSFPISTERREAQVAFDRGLTLAYAFNHRAAEREFRRAAELDPSSPMPWWGVAIVNGPHINYPLVPEDKAEVAWKALSNARKLLPGASPLERDLIEALGTRYVRKQPEDRSKLDRDYAAAMKGVYERHPRNADVVTLYAEALMDLHPWDFWTPKGEPRPWTGEVVATLERAMELDPEHPGAHHLYIHATEASSNPGRAEMSADKLGGLVPDAGHLVHMPAHIYARIGRWDDAARSNEDAIVADAKYRRIDPQPGFYAIYMLHNHHFLSFVRMMQGQREQAVAAAREMVASVPPEFIRDYAAIADGYMAIVPEVHVRFGRWQEVLAEPAPPEGLPIARAMWRFTRAVALNALDRREEAQAERSELHAAIARVPSDAHFGNNEAHTLLRIAKLVLDGEIAARAGRYSAAIRDLEKAVKIEDTLKYDEPPDWILPVRHTLGITLLRAGRPADAERVYREDLERFPANGWSLYGLHEALVAQGKEQAAKDAMDLFRREWRDADTDIESSCMCLEAA